jgi:hypothetical protein
VVTLNLHHEDKVSILIDGPDFDGDRNQTAAVFLEKEELRRLLGEALASATS